MRNIPLYAVLLLGVSPAYALDFSFEKNHCAAGEYRPKKPKSGGTSGLLDSTAWAETGICVEIPIAKLQAATADLGVMTWRGTTRIAGSKKLPATRPNDLFRVKLTYESRHKHLWCQSAQWPMEWSARVIEGTKVAPDRIHVDTARVPGGDSNGAYIKQMSARVELLRHSDNETSLHMRYEVRAPSQKPSWAVAAITEYADRLKKVASGGKAPGAAVDPACPY
jgi:hypothetical protein